MSFLSTTCISISQLIALFIFALMSKIPTLSSNKSFSSIVLLSNSTFVISLPTIELINEAVMSSFPICPNILLKT